MYILNDLRELTRERVGVTGSPARMVYTEMYHGNLLPVLHRYWQSGSLLGSALLGAEYLARCQTGSFLVVTGRLPVATGLPGPSPHHGRRASSTSPRSLRWGAHSD